MRLRSLLPWGSAAGRKAVPETKTAGGFMSLTAEGRASWTGRSYAALSREGFMKNPVAHRSVRLIAEAAASVPWLLYEGDRERPDHAVQSLLGQPNGRMSGPDFFEALYGHLLLSGNAYVEPLLVGGSLRELHLLRPDRIGIVEGRDGWPEAYDYRAGGSVRRFPAETEGLGLLHLKLFHPLDDHLGFPPLAAAQVALDLSNAAATWNKALLDNSARPSGALVYQPKEGGNLSPDQYERLKQELDEGYSGPMRAGRPLLLEGGLDWKSMGLSPKDMDFVEARNGAARDIALAFGVPPMLLGIPGDNTYANYQEANRAFYRLTVLPMLTRTAASLSAWLSGHYEDRLRLEPDLDKVAGLAAERDQLWTRVGSAAFLTDEEKRQAVGY
ncbi:MULTISPECIES: phage portal protein [unclassified Rhizobium]|uniref:phage portal protein n=1 Tax=unclassified Rhizobium TaxID=2613769 RepID=UPI00161AEE39|nr:MULTISPECIES: phage portal protein [unclassified Rhizobium]MBB3539755.1 HK97 family phage portal protein [Rhizobium sp. BK399]MCS3739236.1 HK97 family phage portal protein [Rhizobium sp. BK661]MCS4090439.1 HK97 family phage portal protein [Rhizobium sp. BK176]